MSSKNRRKAKRKYSLREEIRRDLAINPIPIPGIDELIKTLQELENSPSSDADVSRKRDQRHFSIIDSSSIFFRSNNETKSV